MTYISTPKAALTAAMNAADVHELSNARVRIDGGLWLVEFTACELRWTAYVDPATGEVPGLMSEPRAEDEYSPAPLFMGDRAA